MNTQQRFESFIKQHYTGWVWRLAKDGNGSYTTYHTIWLYELYQTFSELDKDIEISKWEKQ